MKVGGRCFGSGLACAMLLAAAPGRGAVVVSFTNSSPLTINDSLAPPTIATPYPATLNVTNLGGMVLSSLTVTIRGLTHGFPSDVTMLLVGPQGQRSILMSQVGGQDRLSVTNVTFTLDDNAAGPLPFLTSLVPGTFRPTNGYLILGHPDLPYDLPLPAPPGNSNSVAALSVFRNTDPNGVWNLYVVDDASGSSGSLAGWSLNVAPAVPLTATRARTNIVLAWPSQVAGCTLQSASNLAANWSNVTTAPVVVGGQNVVTNAATQPEAFYRLIKSW